MRPRTKRKRRYTQPTIAPAAAISISFGSCPTVANSIQRVSRENSHSSLSAVITLVQQANQSITPPSMAPAPRP